MKAKYKRETSRQTMTVDQFLAYTPEKPYKWRDTLIYVRNRSVQSINKHTPTGELSAMLRHIPDWNGEAFIVPLQPDEIVTIIRLDSAAYSRAYRAHKKQIARETADYRAQLRSGFVSPDLDRE